METQIKSFIKTKEGLKIVTIFGYSTKGIPGLEICGLGAKGRNIKEKIIYLTKIRKLKIPMNRFIITVDESIEASDIRWLEFPILLIYWYLGRIIPISKLDNCLCAGSVNPSGVIFQKEMDEKIIHFLLEEMSLKRVERMMLLNSSRESGLSSIDPQALLSHVPLLEFKESYIDKSSAIPRKSFIT